VGGGVGGGAVIGGGVAVEGGGVAGTVGGGTGGMPDGVKLVPHFEQKLAISLLAAPHFGQSFAIFFSTHKLKVISS
jgi:hypothetical protein